MDKLYKIKKRGLNRFLKGLQKKSQLYAPVKTDAVRFEKIDDIDKIYLKEQADIPVKGFFFRKKEVLFNFKGNSITANTKTMPERVFFGLRRCDLNAIKHQNFIFTERYNDPYYKAQRENAILLGYHCDSAPSEYCFCGSMNLEDYYDLMFWEKEDHYLVHVGSEKGEVLLTRDFKQTDIDLTPEMKHIENTDRLKKRRIKDLYNNPGWKEGVNKCLSCAACTTLCPTCYCHEIKDEVSLSDLKQGKRVREWSSCQLKSFTRVAGNFVFREAREERFKHRIYHQLQYFKERYDIEMCVGCGRCITHCPTKIDFIDMINRMNKENEQPKQ